MAPKFSFDLHVHTKYSWDCKVDIDSLIKISRKRKLSGISITDHDTTKGAFEAYSKAKKYDDFSIIPSIEVTTQFGHMIAMFVKDEINTKDYFELLDIAKDEDLILYFPHPGRSPKHAPRLAENSHAVEVINGHSRLTQNVYSKFIQEKFKKTKVAGSDAHHLHELGQCCTIFKNNDSSSIRKSILKGETEVTGLFSTFSNIAKSFDKKFINKKNRKKQHGKV